MNGEDKIWRDGLKPLADDPPEASPEIKQRLLLEFRKTYRSRARVRRPLWWGLGLASAALAVWIGIMILTRPAPRPMAPVPVAHVTPAGGPFVTGPRLKGTVAAKQVKRASKRTRRAVRAEVQTAFYPLPYSVMPAENIRVLRVSLPRSAMSVVGLSVNPDRMFEPVQADVVVGEDGMARAIRFIQ